MYRVRFRKDIGRNTSISRAMDRWNRAGGHVVKGSTTDTRRGWITFLVGE